MHEDRRADPRALRPDTTGPRALLVVIAGGGGLLQAFGAGDRGAEHLAGGGDVALAQHVLRLEIDGIAAELPGDGVDVALDRPDGLRRTEAAEGAVGRGVGGDGDGLDPHVFPAIRAGCVERAAREHHRSEGHVGAAVHESPDREHAQGAVGVASALDLADARVPLGRGLDILFAVVDHPHREAALLRQERGVEGDDRGILFLPAKAPSRHRLGDVDGARLSSKALVKALWT